MRPVNLIPPEERRGDRAPTRTGPIAYVIVGALVLALAGVTAVVLTKNDIADRKDELAQLKAREAAAIEEAERLAPYAEFATLKDARVQTVDSLARSRFDWERVLEELALVLPERVQLTNVTGTVAPGASLESGAGNSLREGITGPALELAGCTTDHETVAELGAALEDIDGVTRVGVNNSERIDEEANLAAAGGECESSGPVVQFEMIAAFDEVAVAALAPSPAAPGTPSEPAGDQTQVADGQLQGQQARESAEEQADQARDAANLVPGTAK